MLASTVSFFGNERSNVAPVVRANSDQANAKHDGTHATRPPPLRGRSNKETAKACAGAQENMSVHRRLHATSARRRTTGVQTSATTNFSSPDNPPGFHTTVREPNVHIFSPDPSNTTKNHEEDSHLLARRDCHSNSSGRYLHPTK